MIIATTFALRVKHYHMVFPTPGLCYSHWNERSQQMRDPNTMATSFTFIFSLPKTATMELLKDTVLFLVNFLNFLLPWWKGCSLTSPDGHRRKVCRLYIINLPQVSQFSKPLDSFLHVEQGSSGISTTWTADFHWIQASVVNGRNF